jgi:hypothetical protein
MVVKDLGSLWNWLPAGALYHDQNAYLKTVTNQVVEDVVEVNESVC